MANARMNELFLPILKEKGVELFLLREDLLHAHISGNKYRKLKYNLLEAQKQGKTKLLTFGGAFSNHIAAVAAAGQQFGFKTVGVIRGEQSTTPSPTLRYAEACGMQLHFVSRSAYREKTTVAFTTQLIEKFGDFYSIPEGGTNSLALQGCAEIWESINAHFSKAPDYVCTCVGTGGTIAGLIAGNESASQVLGFSALKGSFLTKDVTELLQMYHARFYPNWLINNDYHFGGYAKHQPVLIDFMNDFKATQGISLDPVYTGKMMYGILDLVAKDYFPKGSRILAIHTGGLQGVEGFNQRFGNLLD